MVKIEKGIPFPRKEDRPAKAFWSQLRKGDSFVYNDFIDNAHAAASYYSKTLGKVFKARRDLQGIVRVWRLE